MPHTPPDRRPSAGAFPPAGVRAVAFDAVGTLVEPWPPVGEAYAAAGCRHGVPLDPVSARSRFRTAWRRQEMADAMANPAFATSRHRERERWRAIVAEVFDTPPATPAIFADLWEHFGRPDAWRTLTGGLELVWAAADAGCIIALASNFDERLLAIAPHLDGLSRADHVFASSDLGWRKPARQFFGCVEQRLGCAPHELLLVGDDPALDIAAAEAAGWQAVRVG